jgi:hypothetical protein
MRGRGAPAPSVAPFPPFCSFDCVDSADSVVPVIFVCRGLRRERVATSGACAVRVARHAPLWQSFRAMSRGVVVMFLSWTVACGGATMTASPKEEGGDAALTDGGGLACGDALCSPSQICLTPAYGCVAMARPDGGVCPDGTEYSVASGGCLESPPPPSFVSPPPRAGSFDCSGEEADADCSTVSAPIPSGCSRVCRETCA